MGDTPALPDTESAWHFCILYFIQHCPGCSDTSVEFGLGSVFCDWMQDKSARHSRYAEVERVVDQTLRSLKASGYLSDMRMPQLTDSGRNYLDSLTTPHSDAYRSLLDPMAAKLTPQFDDAPGQPVGTFY